MKKKKKKNDPPKKQATHCPQAKKHRANAFCNQKNHREEFFMHCTYIMWKERKGETKQDKTLLIWLEKVSAVEAVAPPRLFMILPVTMSIIGMEMPSPMAPRKPKLIKTRSTPSAWLKIYPKDEYFFFFPITVLFSSSLPILETQQHVKMELRCWSIRWWMSVSDCYVTSDNLHRERERKIKIGWWGWDDDVMEALGVRYNGC